MRHLFVLFLMAMFVAGCSKKVDVTPCALVPITPTPTHSNFEQFTVLGPEVNGEVTSVFIQDDHAYIEVGDSMVILDIHDPSQPSQLGAYPVGAAPIKIEGNDAYAYWDERLHILDISNPGNPVEVGCPDGSNLDLKGAEFSEDYAYLPDREQGLKIFDVTQLTSPIEVAHYQSRSAPRLHWHMPPGELLPRPVYIQSQPMLALDVAVSGQYAYVGEGRAGIDSLFGGQLTVLDVSNPGKPKRVDTFTMPQNTAVMQVILAGNYAFVSTFSMHEAQLTIVLDISDPEQPVEVASFPTGALLAVYNGFAYFHDYERGLIVWDVTDPASPERAGTIELPLVSSARYVGQAVFIADIAFDDNYAYIAMEYGGLHVVDISDPTDAREVSVVQYEILPMAQYLSVSGNVAYVGNAYGNIGLMDISEPRSLPVLGAIEGLGAMDVAVSDGLAYVARDEDGVSVVDMSDMENPSLISTYHSGDFRATRIVAQDEFLFVLEEDVGLHILDASDLSNLMPIYTVSLNVTRYDDIAVWNDYVYVALGPNNGELHVIDISKPTRPRTVGYLRYPDYFTSVAADDKYVYVVTSSKYVAIFDVQNPDSPSLVSLHDSGSFLEDIHLEDGKLYLALRDGGGIAVAEFETP